MKKVCSHSHFEPVKCNNGADNYCNKEATRIDGPWTFGVRPARRNQKGDTARWNKDVLEIGPVRAVDEGYIRLDRLDKLVATSNLYKMLKFKPYHHPTDRGEWHWGCSGAGKTHFTHTAYPDHYVKQQNKWFDGYEG